MNDLFPCPMCGHQPRWERDEFRKHCDVIICDYCGMRTSGGANRDNLAEIWNTRAEPAGQAGLSALRELSERATAGRWEGGHDGIAEMHNVSEFIESADGSALIAYGQMSREDRKLIVAAVNYVRETLSSTPTDEVKHG